MKCQSDYDKEDQAILRQADECVTEWWEPGREKAAGEAVKPAAAEAAPAAAEEEALRRGLLRKEGSGAVCLSCAEESGREDG